MDIRRRLERGLARWQSKRRGAAVLVSLVDASGKDGSYDVLFERRARSLTCPFKAADALIKTVEQNKIFAHIVMSIKFEPFRVFTRSKNNQRTASEMVF